MPPPWWALFRVPVKALSSPEWAKTCTIQNQKALLTAPGYHWDKKQHREILHCILYFKEAGFDLNKIVSNGKRFMAYEILFENSF